MRLVVSVGRGAWEGDLRGLTRERRRAVDRWGAGQGRAGQGRSSGQGQDPAGGMEGAKQLRDGTK